MLEIVEEDSMRVLVAIALLGACKGDANSPETATTGDKLAEPAPPKRFDLPILDDASRVMVVTGAKPAALVWIGATGKLEVGRAGPAWSGDITAKDRIAADLAELRKTVLEAVVATSGPASEEARAELRQLDRLLARDQAIAQARAAGILGATSSPDPEIPGRGRLPSATALAIDKLPPTAPLVIATPSAPATVVARALARTGGALGVDHRGKLAVLDLAFAHERPAVTGGASWIELFADAKGLHVVMQPEDDETIVPWIGAAIDHDGIRTAYKNRGGELYVDVIVREDTTTQTLVDILAVVAGLGAHVAVAEGPSTASERRAQIAIARRADPGAATPPSVTPGQPNAQGDLDKAVIREYVQREMSKIRHCYEKHLVARPYLSGTVSTQFFIAPDGTVATAHAAGMDAEVASCIANVLRKIEFPKPNGGGGVQVNYPFTFQTAAP
jgi:hypothetical protein